MPSCIAWNVNSIRARFEGVAHLLEHQRPDVLALQETKVVDDDFPKDAISELGYHSYFIGQPSYNGVAIISREPLEPIMLDVPDVLADQKRLIAAKWRDYIIVDAYVPMGESCDSPKYQYKLAWLEAFRAMLKQLPKQQLLVCGDFNIAPADLDVHDPTRWQDRVLVSGPERAHWQALLDSGLIDAYRFKYPDDPGFTWWDYRQFAFRRKAGLRIDHWLVSDSLQPHIKDCEVLIEYRQQERPSDHAPVALYLHES